MPACPLCFYESLLRLYTSFGPKRLFRHCAHCDLIFADPEHLPEADAEKKRYEAHNNSRADAGYVTFLSPFREAVRENCRPNARGLDYGCGPAPVLAELLEEDGYPMRLYDPFFVSDSANQEALTGQYDFICCTETAEHFHKPAKEFDTLHALLGDGGMLFLGTLLHPGTEAFPGWHYHNDFTHVVFYSRKTMAFLAARYGWQYRQPSERLAIFTLAEK